MYDPSNGVLTAYFQTIDLKDLVPLMRAIKAAPLGYNFSKRTKDDLIVDAVNLGHNYASQKYPRQGYDRAIADFQKILEDQRRGGAGDAPGHDGTGKGPQGSSGQGTPKPSQGDGDGNPIEVRAEGVGGKHISKAASDAANQALKRAKESARDQIKQSEAKADEKFITKKEAKDLIEQEVSTQLDEQFEEKNRVYRVEIKAPGQTIVETGDGVHHRAFKEVLAAVSAGLNVLLVGPAGAGKTHLAQQVSQALKLQFHFTGAVASEYKLLGFIDAQGRYITTEYRKAYEHGGVFLWDEMDASSPQALLSFNAGLANGVQDFPDQVVSRHEKFRAIASANTYGHGADRVYVGRNQLDAASLDRFYMIAMDYDEHLEAALYGKSEWVQYVWKARKATRELNLRHVVSMRAIHQGLTMLGSSVSRDDVERAVLWKHLDKADVTKVKAHMGTQASSAAASGGLHPYQTQILSQWAPGKIISSPEIPF